MKRNITINTYENQNLLFKEQTSCELEDDNLIYNSDNDRIKINLHNFSLTKENDETIFKLTLNKCTLYLKELNKFLDIPITHISYENSDNTNITIVYQLESQESPFKIEITIGEIINEI